MNDVERESDVERSCFELCLQYITRQQRDAMLKGILTDDGIGCLEDLREICNGGSKTRIPLTQLDGIQSVRSTEVDKVSGCGWNIDSCDDVRDDELSEIHHSECVDLPLSLIERLDVRVRWISGPQRLIEIHPMRMKELNV